MIDIGQHIGAVTREVAGDGETMTVTMRRHYTADKTDVWNALTDPERIVRWFLPISGDLREGGTFSLEGNASGDILTCQPPERLVVTFGGETSIVELRLSGDGDRTELVLEHSVPLELAGGPAGALYVGPGWDGAFVALGLHLGGTPIDNPVERANSREGQEFCVGSIDAWTVVVESAGGDAGAIAAAREVAFAQYAPDLV